MDSPQRESQSLPEAAHSDTSQADVDRHVFHLKTLYDLSRTIYGSIETDTILKNFLLMITGNFGVVQGGVALIDPAAGEPRHFVCVGCDEGEQACLRRWCTDTPQADGLGPERGAPVCALPPPAAFSAAISFAVADSWQGWLALGPKLVGTGYSDGDRELVETLTNNLVVALRNARSFEEIRGLNAGLEAKNQELETALSRLQASLRKVELLEGIKESLCKFVSHSVKKLVETSASGDIPNKKKQDLSVLFVDIEGYTSLCERLGSTATSDILEKHFSVFMDAIYRHNGDICDTAGDGLMVLFLNEDEKTNAREAVETALAIKAECDGIGRECGALDHPLKMNMGINSGRALFGASKFESVTGARWVYTAIGQVINVAARIGAKATGGDIFLTDATAHRVAGHFDLAPVGKLELKNVSNAVEVFKLRS